MRAIRSLHGRSSTANSRESRSLPCALSFLLCPGDSGAAACLDLLGHSQSWTCLGSPSPPCACPGDRRRISSHLCIEGAGSSHSPGGATAALWPAWLRVPLHYPSALGGATHRVALRLGRGSSRSRQTCRSRSTQPQADQTADKELARRLLARLGGLQGSKLNS